MKSTYLISVVLFVTLFLSDINHATEKIEFGYVGNLGPDFWHKLSAESAICETGTKQSPIDITRDDLKSLAEPPSPKFDDACDVESIHNGNTVEIFSGKEEVPLPAEITIDGEKYELQQFHFHTPSEHRIEGRHFEIEQHLVFKSESEKISVVAVLYNVGEKPSAFMAPIVNNLPEKSGNSTKLDKVELKKLLKDVDGITKSFTYSGSLTTPPCTEGVTWYVNKEPQSVSFQQFNKLRDAIGFNSRFTQLREGENNPENESAGLVDTYKVKKRSLYGRGYFRN
ncbi:alpha carbonic anhydrase [Rhizophagus diaphanus]|nr:alpha carbonic anhydrase [Rhizophagus diaphanus] [Rhizophagus sp. MUCL 43196]